MLTPPLAVVCKFLQPAHAQRQRQQDLQCSAGMQSQPLQQHGCCHAGKRQLTLGSNHFTTFESPFGELLKDDGTLWSSNQYSLDYWFYHQLTRCGTR